jgi:hypothetical protein
VNGVYSREKLSPLAYMCIYVHVNICALTLRRPDSSHMAVYTELLGLRLESDRFSTPVLAAVSSLDLMIALLVSGLALTPGLLEFPIFLPPPTLTLFFIRGIRSGSDRIGSGSGSGSHLTAQPIPTRNIDKSRALGEYAAALEFIVWGRRGTALLVD